MLSFISITNTICSFINTFCHNRAFEDIYSLECGQKWKRVWHPALKEPWTPPLAERYGGRDGAAHMNCSCISPVCPPGALWPSSVLNDSSAFVLVDAGRKLQLLTTWAQRFADVCCCLVSTAWRRLLLNHSNRLIKYPYMCQRYCYHNNNRLEVQLAVNLPSKRYI